MWGGVLICKMRASSNVYVELGIDIRNRPASGSTLCSGVHTTFLPLNPRGRRPRLLGMCLIIAGTFEVFRKANLSVL